MLATAQRAFAAAEREALAPLGLTPATLRLLDLAARSGPLAPAEAAARLGVSRPTVTGWLQALAADELLERHPDDGDGRRARLTLTAEGVRTHRAADEAIRRRHNRLLAGAIDPVAQADLMASHERLADASL